MVDYSKWDNLDASDDEADNKPRVQRFEGPQQVTIGGGRDGQVQIAPSAQGTAEVEDAADSGDEPMEPPDGEPGDMQLDGDDRREDVLQCRALAERALRVGDASEAVRLLEKAMRLGGATCPGVEDLLASARQRATERGEVAAQATSARRAQEAQQANGGVVEGRYSWFQTRETVEVNVFAPEGTKAKAVEVKVSETGVCVTASGAKLLEGDWEFKVEPEEDPDWEVREFEGRRVVRLSVRKATVPGGLSVVVWWKRILKGDPGIDVEGIAERKKEKTENFAKAWEEAHVAFREKVRTRTPITIDMGAGGEEAAMTD